MREGEEGGRESVGFPFDLFNLQWVVGGYDTVQCYSDVHMLDLGSYASQEYVGL